MGSAAVYGAVAVVIAAHWSPLRALAVLGCALLALAAGLSRVYLNVHYFTDVLAGWSLGVAWAVGLAAAVRRRNRPRSRQLPVSGRPGAAAGVDAKPGPVG
jgi:undecaprenyl-diphosphatase